MTALHRLALGLGLTLAGALPAEALFFTAPPPLIYATGCSNTTLHTITATGAGNVAVPSGCGHVTLKAWGGGSAGAGSTGTGNGGNGGGFATYSAYAVTPENTLYYSVAAAITGTTAEGSAGNNSWLNISSNAQPTAIAAGVFASGGFTSSVSTGGSYGPTGATGYTGGIGGVQAGHAGGGGGGAGSGGTGGAGAADGTAGTGGTPDGGPGSDGLNTNASPGTAPGGAGGGASGTSHTGGNGAAGQISYQFSAFLNPLPANDNFTETRMAT